MPLLSLNIDVATQSGFFFLSNRGSLVKVGLSDIRYIRAERRYVAFHLAGGNKIVARTSIRYVVSQLASCGFCQVHRSYAVNVHDISRIWRELLYLGDHPIPIGRHYRAALLQQLQHIRLPAPVK